MNLRLVSKLLGVVSLLIGGAMIFSLPWAWPTLGVRSFERMGVDSQAFETRGFVAMLISIVVSLAVGGLLWQWGRKDHGKLFRKEAMAVVGLSWVLATVLGALPFYFSRTGYTSSLQLYDVEYQSNDEEHQAEKRYEPPHVFWKLLDKPLSQSQFDVLNAISHEAQGKRS